MSIQWTEIYSVNIKNIDKQHQHLFNLINKLRSFKKSSIEKDDLMKVIDELEDYAVYHFKTEEDYFAKTAYPGADSHIKKHNFYKKQLIELKNNVQHQSDQQNLDEMYNFLKDWWIKHILKNDMDYSAFLNKHGIY